MLLLSPRAGSCMPDHTQRGCLGRDCQAGALQPRGRRECHPPLLRAWQAGVVHGRGGMHLALAEVISEAAELGEERRGALKRPRSPCIPRPRGAATLPPCGFRRAQEGPECPYSHCLELQAGQRGERTTIDQQPGGVRGLLPVASFRKSSANLERERNLGTHTLHGLSARAVQVPGHAPLWRTLGHGPLWRTLGEAEESRMRKACRQRALALSESWTPK